jgi:LSD1 subclass zinc finger protein
MIRELFDVQAHRHLSIVACALHGPVGQEQFREYDLSGWMYVLSTMHIRVILKPYFAGATSIRNCSLCKTGTSWIGSGHEAFTE